MNQIYANQCSSNPFLSPEIFVKVPFSRKKMIFIIRLLVIITTAYFIIFTGDEPSSVGYLFIVAYLLTNLIVFWLPERFFYEGRFFYALILCDSIMLPTGIFLSGYIGSDLYLLYFFVLALTAMGAKFEYLMINILIFSFLYGWYLFHNGFLTEGSAVNYGLRIPFILTITMFYGYVTTIRLNDKDARIQEERERYEQIVQATDVLMCIVDQESRLLFANQKFVELYGHEDEKNILGIPYSEFQSSEEDSEDPMDYIHTVYQTGGTIHFEAYDRHNDKTFANTLNPVRNPVTNDVFAVSIISKDITERIEREKKLNDTIELLQRTRDQLIQKDKMAALGRMASGIAHEIRNPLEIITMGVDYLEYNLPRDNRNLQKSIDKIYNAITRANNIIRDTLSFSRQSNFQVKNIPLYPLLDNSLSLSKHIIRKSGIILERDYENELQEIAADHNMLEQVLLNLIKNAVDAMKESKEKKLVIRTYKQKVTQIDYKTGSRRSDFFKLGGEMVIVEISDTGAGIPKAVLPKIFEPFFTTKSTNEGTGLGLSLVHMIMERLNGTIDVRSRVDHGTTFYVKLQPAIPNPDLKKV